jgi:hypothetical protein
MFVPHKRCEIPPQGSPAYAVGHFGGRCAPGGTAGWYRGHHPACFSPWLADGGVKPGIAYGSTDDIAAIVSEKKVHVHDFHATILYLLGFDHEKLTYRHACRDFRLTDVHGNVVKGILN